MHGTLVRRLMVAACAGVALVGCGDAFDTDLTQTPQYAGLIGVEYRAKTGLYAVGVWRANSREELENIVVLPVPQTGPEIAFRRNIPAGHVFRIVKVRKRFMPFDNGLEFVVAADGLDLPAGVEIVISMCCYFQATDGFPDASRFERVRAPVQ
jgi:hypothetical protein